jgi:hypothetical protein
MTFRQFQSIFRPLVNQAWAAQCDITGVPPNNKTAKDRWYREQIRAATDGRLHSTKGICEADMRFLLDRFTMLSRAGGAPRVEGFSHAQNQRFAELTEKAWQVFCSRAATPFKLHTWLDAELAVCGYSKRKASRKEGFDKIMAHFAVIAMDIYWIERTAAAGERRLRWQIRRFLGDLDYLTKTTHAWAYVEAIWDQSEQLPHDMGDAPKVLLLKVLQMLDTHIRRLCKDYDIRPCWLPSRSHAHVAPTVIREDNHHLHVGHELEHCEPVHVS